MSTLPMSLQHDVWAIDPVAYFATRSLITEPDAQHKYALSGEGEDAVYQCGLSLAPAVTMQGVNTCPGSTIQCRALCLKFAGQNNMTTSDVARILRTRLLMEHPEVFREYLRRDLDKARAKARKAGLRFAFRFNTLSDVDVIKIAGDLIEPGDQWLDYTKVAGKYRAWLTSPHPQYHLTFSRSETNHAQCLEFLALGGTVTVVVKTEAHKQKLLRGWWYGFPSVDGDLSDRRWQDPKGHWVVLVAKGRARKALSGPREFVVSWTNEEAASELRAGDRMVVRALGRTRGGFWDGRFEVVTVKAVEVRGDRVHIEMCEGWSTVLHPREGVSVILR